jgi:hypothetical protein
MSEKEIKLNIEVEGGEDGYTPIKGKDYFTKEEQELFVSEIMSKINIPTPKDGEPGKDAEPVDYKKIEKFVKSEVAKIPKPEVTDVEIDFDSVVVTVLEKIPKNPDIDYESIKDYCLKEIQKIENNRETRVRTLNSGGPTTRLGELVDVNIDGATTGQVLRFDGLNWVPGTDVDLSGYVPYTGATTTLDLNNKDLNSVNTLEVKQATTNAVIIGDVSGDARGSGALDLQSHRVLVTNVASGSESVALGVNNTASANRSTATGYNNTASGDYSQAFGYSNNATIYASTAIGYANYAIGNYSSALGNSNYAEAYFSASVGSNNTASTYQGSAFGYGNTASANYSSAFGFLNHTEGVYSVALGANAQATSPSSLAIGSGTASGYYSSDLRTKATGNGSVSVGTNSGYYGTANTASGTYSQAFGVGNNASGNYSTTIGYGNSVSLDSSTAVGYGNAVYVTNSLALGVNISNNTANTIEIGASNASKIQLSSTYLRPFTDNQKTLGGITNRWTTIYGNGGLMLGYTAKTANYTLTATNYLVNCTANTFTITLPTAVAITGQIFIIKNSGTGIITLATTSSQTIDGVASGIFTLVQWDSITVTSNGANWIITN